LIEGDGDLVNPDEEHQFREIPLMKALYAAFFSKA
jgi:hypothetical protein